MEFSSDWGAALDVGALLSKVLLHRIDEAALVCAHADKVGAVEGEAGERERERETAAAAAQQLAFGCLEESLKQVLCLAPTGRLGPMVEDCLTHLIR